MGRFTENELQTQSNGKAMTVGEIVKKTTMVQRFSDVLGGQDKANQFLASLTSAVNGSTNLQKCNPMQVIGCAMIAASLNLDINPNLGFASIVPYKDGKTQRYIPQFQMGWKGFVQLAMRTGQYKTMNVTEVYEDEFDGYDPFKGELVYHKVTDGDRSNGRTDKIVGYCFYFELVSGFSKMTYMSKEDARNHAKRFSKAYQADLKYQTTSSPWSTLFDAMAEKTIVKNTLSKWGILSTQMGMAQKADMASVTDGDTYDYLDEGETIIEQNEETKAEPQTEEPKAEESQDEVFNEGDFQ